ncbi:tetratricopeptide repeat protein [Roseimaritima ulvae]|uniref:Tetratricopeptide repeat protein n=1 Tax=Roseimaritima ulvae TaxID=980254 RepID=A0A5B9QMN9_9BACT|nr:tetratricopeptide repeat protein [Roseimaritima ulvae]QEG40204.1 Tetratricopeptide repeat protein [Roseimaritima ulvae]
MRVLKSEFFGGRPVTADVTRLKLRINQLRCVSLEIFAIICSGCLNDTSSTEAQPTRTSTAPAQDQVMAIRDEGLAQRLIHEGHGEYERSNLERAIELLDEGATNDPTRWDAFYLSGKLRLDVGDPSGALERLSVAHSLAPDDYDIMIELGNAYNDNGDFKNAEATWRNALASSPDRDLAYNNLGIMQYELRKHADAAATFTAGIERCSSLLLFKGRALSCMEIGEFDQAIQDLGHLMDSMPDTAVFYWYRGRCRFGLGQHDLALSDAKRACEIDPDDSGYNSFLQSCRTLQDGG